MLRRYLGVHLAVKMTTVIPIVAYTSRLRHSVRVRTYKNDHGPYWLTPETLYVAAPSTTRPPTVSVRKNRSALQPFQKHLLHWVYFQCEIF